MEDFDLYKLIGNNVGVIQTKMRPTKKMFKYLLRALRIQNLDKAYDFFKRIESGKYKMCLSFLCANYAELRGKYAEKVYNYKKGVLDREKFAKGVVVLENPNFDSIFRVVYANASVKYATYMTWEEIKEKYMKFNCVVMNPPYNGNAKGGKLYMQMVNAFYNQLLDDDDKKSQVIAIHPTSVIDGEQDPQFAGLRMDDLIQIDNPREVFPDAEIKTGLGIFVYSKNGNYKLYSDEIKEKNMSEYDLKKWSIYKKIRDGQWKSLADIPGHVEIRKGQDKRVKAAEENGVWNCHCVVIPKEVGDRKSPTWYSLAPSKWLKPLYKYDGSTSQQVFPMPTKRRAIQLIKWTVSDMVVFTLQWVKINIANSISLLKRIPLPPMNWNCDDASVMAYLGLTQEEMDFIHADVKDKGLKAQLGMTEAELMAYIDEINK